MPTLDTVDTWIQENLLESDVWTNFERQNVAYLQATRNLGNWYPDIALSDEVVAAQVIWEIKGLDPILKYSGQGVRSLTDNEERVDYGDYIRPKVAPEVHNLIGPPIDERTDAVEPPLLFGGTLL